MDPQCRFRFVAQPSLSRFKVAASRFVFVSSRSTYMSRRLLHFGARYLPVALFSVAPN